MALIKTRAAKIIGDAEEKLQCVRFESYKPKEKIPNSNSTSRGHLDQRQGYNSKQQIADLRRIKHEVYKLGMSGFNPTKKEEAKVALAISLGAKPPKKEYKNYKELMAQRKEEKIKEKQKEDLMMIGKNLMGSRTARKKRKTNNDVGHFLDGYGKVEKKDLQKEEKQSKGRRKKKKII